jgi:hypothetical protein
MVLNTLGEKKGEAGKGCGRPGAANDLQAALGYIESLFLAVDQSTVPLCQDAIRDQSIENGEIRQPGK